MPTIGLLYPGHSAEDDFARAEAVLRRESPGVDYSLPVTTTSVGEDAHRVDALLDLGDATRLSAGADEAMAAHSPDALVWACTSGSFVFGWDGARRQVDQLARHAGRPASSTSLAFVAAVQALGLRRVAVAASYPDDVAGHFVDLLERAGSTVTALASHGILTASEVGELSAEQVVDLVARAPRAGAQALLVPDTAMHTLDLLPELEAAAGMPVLTANQVSVWEGLRLVGAAPQTDRLGALFAHRPAA